MLIKLGPCQLEVPVYLPEDTKREQTSRVSCVLRPPPRRPREQGVGPIRGLQHHLDSTLAYVGKRSAAHGSGGGAVRAVGM